VEILILHPGGLGDIILSLPAIALIRDSCPSARITIAGNIDHLAAVVSGYAENVVSLSTLPLHHLYMDGALPETEVRFWNSFDRIVSWTGWGDPEFIRNFRRIHPNVCIAPWRPKPGETRHVSQLFVESLNVGIPSGTEPSPAAIILDSKLCNEGKQWLLDRGWDDQDPLTALHPGAGSKAKRWAISRFIKLAQHLVLQEKRKLLVVEGPAEPELAKQFAQELPETDVIQAESIPLNLLAAIINQCGAFIGNDSGIAHLSAALRIPSVVLFGPTLPQHWAPLGPNVVVLRNAHGCEGCAAGGKNHTCLENITVEEVIRNRKFEIRKYKTPRFSSL
jgi:heptosyltransferase III